MSSKTFIKFADKEEDQGIYYGRRKDFVSFKEWWNVYENNSILNEQFCRDAWNAALDAVVNNLKA